MVPGFCAVPCSQCFQLQCHLPISLSPSLIWPLRLSSSGWGVAMSDCNLQRCEEEDAVLLHPRVSLSHDLVLPHGEFQSLFQLWVISSGLGLAFYEKARYHCFFYFCNHNTSLHTGSITSPALESFTDVPANWEWRGRERETLSSLSGPTLHLLVEGFEWLVGPLRSVQVARLESYTTKKFILPVSLSLKQASSLSYFSLSEPTKYIFKTMPAATIH